MKKIYGILFLFSLFATACSTSAEKELVPGEQDNVVLTFKTCSESTSRTTLAGSGKLQHVKQVYLYVFKEDISGTYTYERVKELSPWPDPNDVNYKYVTRTYSFALSPGNYKFIAIGLDDQAGITYDLPVAVGEGTTFDDATVTLAVGLAGQNIAISELFAGTQDLTVDGMDYIEVTPIGQTAVTVGLWRRVAGVMGWFTNVPEGIDEIQIVLYTRQNKSIYLKARPEGNRYPFGLKNPANFADYITDPINDGETGKILVSIPVASDITSSTIVSSGSFVLPVAAPEVGDGSEYTLLIHQMVNGVIRKSMRVEMNPEDDLYISPTGGGTGILDMGGPFRFPLVANRFYGIGSAEAPVDLGGARDDVMLTVNSNWLWVGDGEFEFPIL